MTEEQIEVAAVGSRLVGRALEAVEALRPWTLRCREVGTDRTVIVKRTRLPPGESWDRTARFAVPFLSEVAALQFLGPHGPGLLGVDVDAGVVVIPELTGSGLDGLLLTGTAEAATDGVLRWAEALGALHAHAAGRRAEYLTIREALGPNPDGNVGRRVPGLVEALAGLGLSAPVDELHAALVPEDPELDTWVHRDPCPDNVLLLPDGSARFIDFEFGAYGSACQDAAVLRMCLPTCWCAGTLPDELIAAGEARYRQAATVGLPALADDRRFAAAVADGSAHHLAVALTWWVAPSLEEDQTFGIATTRERVMTRLARFEPGDRWPGLRDLASALEPLLRDRWGPIGLSPYPAFRQLPAA